MSEQTSENQTPQTTDGPMGEPPVDDTPEQMKVRALKRQHLIDSGISPYPVTLPITSTIKAVRADYAGLETGEETDVVVGVAGRVMLMRNGGKLCFATLQDGEGNRLQVMLSAKEIGVDSLAEYKADVDLGDHLFVHGRVISSRRGELSVLAEPGEDVPAWRMASKALRPLPKTYTAQDGSEVALSEDMRVRRRYLDMIVRPAARDMVRLRAGVVRSLRHYFEDAGFVEIETPMLQVLHGGAAARPFKTHMNAYDTDLYLRIAPELYLKRLAVAGMDAIFEMGRSFRNEGADNTHNPEFTSLEVYRAGGDYETMRQLTQDLFQRVAVAVNGSCVCLRPVGSPGTEGTAGSDVVHLDGVDLVPFDLSGEWPVVGVHDAISRAVGRTITPDTPIPELEELCVAHGLDLPPVLGHGELIGVLYDALVEARTVRPTFYRDFPKSTSPLTRAHRVDARLAERWDLVAFGVELGTAYTELTDPLDQRQRFTEQSLAAAAGDPEAMSIDNAFLDDLEIGLAPTGGLGLGMDRMVMLLTGSNIRQVLAFPYVRPLQGGGVR